MTTNNKRNTAVKDSAYQAAKTATASGNALFQKKKFGEARLAYVKALGIYAKEQSKGCSFAISVGRLSSRPVFL